MKSFNAAFIKIYIEELDGVCTVADDILIIGNRVSMEEAVAYHNGKLEVMFNRCRERNIKLNNEKVEFKRTEMLYIENLY